MKKKITTGIMIAGAAILSAGLAGCGAQNTKQAEVTKDSLIEKAADVFASSKSVDADLDMDMDVKLSGSGFSMDIKYDAKMDVEVCKDGTSHLNGHVKMSALGMNADSEVEMYTVKEGNELIQYYMKSQSGQEAGSWMHTKSGDYALGTAEKLDVSEILEAFSEMQDMFSDLKLQKDTVDYNNVNCYLMDGTIKGEKLAEFISEYGSDIDQTSIEAYKKMDFKASFYFKAKDETPYAVVVDMKDAIEKIVADELGQTEGVDMDVSAEEMKVSLMFNSFDNVKEIKVPEEVKQKAVETTEPFDITELFEIQGQF